MIRLFAIIMCVSAFSACGAQHQATVSVGPFESYVQAFKDAGATQGKDIRINDLVMQFTKLPTDTEAGNCEVSEGQTPVININSDDWAAMDEGKRTELVFHELGHCILRRVHKSGITQDGIPTSIMDPYTIDGSIFTPNQQFYIQELFSEQDQF